MSISDNQIITNPATKFIQWSGSDEGNFFYHYDKNTDSQIKIEDGTKFIVIDQLCSICGFNEKLNANIYSNEVHNTTKEILVVKCNKTIMASGLYNDIKLLLAQQGGKYCKIVYAGLLENNKIKELVRLQFKGSSLSAYIEASIRDGDIISLQKATEPSKKGKTIYYAPIISADNKVEVSIMEEAKKIDKDILKPFFNRTIPNSFEDIISDFDLEDNTSHTVSEPDLGEMTKGMPF